MWVNQLITPTVLGAVLCFKYIELKYSMPSHAQTSCSIVPKCVVVLQVINKRRAVVVDTAMDGETGWESKEGGGASEGDTGDAGDSASTSAPFTVEDEGVLESLCSNISGVVRSLQHRETQERGLLESVAKLEEAGKALQEKEGQIAAVEATAREHKEQLAHKVNLLEQQEMIKRKANAFASEFNPLGLSEGVDTGTAGTRAGQSSVDGGGVGGGMGGESKIGHSSALGGGMGANSGGTGGENGASSEPVSEMDRLFDGVMRQASKMLGADRGTLFLVDRRKRQLWSKVAGGSASVIRVPMDKGIAGSVALSKEVANIPDVYQDERFDPSNDEKTGYGWRETKRRRLRETGGQRVGLGVMDVDDKSAFSRSRPCITLVMKTLISPFPPPLRPPILPTTPRLGCYLLGYLRDFPPFYTGTARAASSVSLW